MKMRTWDLSITVLLCVAFSPTVSKAQSQIESQYFEVIERKPNSEQGDGDYRLHRIFGNERTNNALNRLSIISENQYDYPVPESGCGPIAMLNILVWYQKFGLIQPISRQSDALNYKHELFNKIDTRLAQTVGESRSPEDGTALLHVAIVMDTLVNEYSGGKVRIHTDQFVTPLSLNDFMQVMPNFRAGYLVVRPKDPNTGQLLNFHAVTVIRVDRAGYITLGTWGQVYRGILKKRGDEQWFIPQDPKQMELQITALFRFIPFEPVTAANP